jgi:hypothetical protein
MSRFCLVTELEHSTDKYWRLGAYKVDGAFELPGQLFYQRTSLHDKPFMNATTAGAILLTILGYGTIGHYDE